MNFDPNIEYYLIHAESKKYATLSGFSLNKDNAVKFKIDQLRRRFKVSAKAKDAFLVKLKASGYYLESVKGDDSGFFTFKSKIEHSGDDILWCDATYHYGQKVIKRRVLYTPNRGIVRKPKDVSGDLTKIEFVATEITGKAL